MAYTSPTLVDNPIFSAYLMSCAIIIVMIVTFPPLPGVDIQPSPLFQWVTTYTMVWFLIWKASKCFGESRESKDSSLSFGKGHGPSEY